MFSDVAGNNYHLLIFGFVQMCVHLLLPSLPLKYLNQAAM